MQNELSRHAQPMEALWEIHMLSVRLGVAHGGVKLGRWFRCGLNICEKVNLLIISPLALLLPTLNAQ